MNPSTPLNPLGSIDRLRQQPWAGADRLPRGLLQYNARFARGIDQEFLEFRRSFVQFRGASSRAVNRGDLSRPDGHSASIPRNPRAACIFSPPDLRAWREQRLGVKTANGSTGAGRPRSPPPAMAPLSPCPPKQYHPYDYVFLQTGRPCTANPCENHPRPVSPP